MEAIGYGIVAMIFFGLSNALAKKPSQHISLPLMIFYRTLASSGTLLLITFLFFAWHDFHWQIVWQLLGISLLGYAGLLSFYQGIKEGAVSIITTLSNASSLITILLAIVFLHEPLSLLFILASLLCFLGMIFLSYNPPIQWTKGAHYGILTFFLWGITFFLLTYPTRSSNGMLTAFFLEFFVGFWNMLFLFFSRKKSSEKKQSSVSSFLLLLFVIGFSIGIANAFYLLGIAKGAVSVLALTTLGIPLVVAVLSYFLYKERLTKKELLGMMFVLGGLGILFL